MVWLALLSENLSSFVVIVILVSLYISLARDNFHVYFRAENFWAVSLTSVENTLGRWVREEKSACWSGIQVQCGAIKVAVLFVSLVSISFHCWSALAHVAGQRSIVFWQWNVTRQVEFHFQARFTFVAVESTQKFIFHSLVLWTLSLFFGRYG